MFLISVAVFSLVHLFPGDPAGAMLGDRATDAQIEALRQELGLDRPIFSQYAQWLGSLMRGDLGESVVTGAPVASTIFSRLPVTVALTIFSTLLSVAIAIPTGVAAALRPGGITDLAVRFGTLLGVSTPSFFLALMLMLVFAVNLQIFPAVGFTGFSVDPWAAIVALTLPATAFGLRYAAVLSRMTRASLLEVLQADYVQSARSRGYGAPRIIWRHALPTALIPVITILGLNIGDALGSSVIIETIFGLPGIGSLLVTSVEARDYPTVQGVVLLVAGLYLLVSLIVDILYAVVDPRISYG